MIRAAGRGLIPYDPNVPLTANWWRRTHLIIQEIERQDVRALNEQRQQLTLALLGLPPEKIDQAAERTIQYINDLRDTTFPWLIQPRKEIAAELTDAWTEAYGDVDSPEMQEKIAETIKALKYG